MLNKQFVRCQCLAVPFTPCAAFCWVSSECVLPIAGSLQLGFSNLQLCSLIGSEVQMRAKDCRRRRSTTPRSRFGHSNFCLCKSTQQTAYFTRCRHSQCVLTCATLCFHTMFTLAENLDNRGFSRQLSSQAAQPEQRMYAAHQGHMMHEAMFQLLSPCQVTSVRWAHPQHAT
jgi:hypothetical protein